MDKSWPEMTKSITPSETLNFRIAVWFFPSLNVNRFVPLIETVGLIPLPKFLAVYMKVRV